MAGGRGRPAATLCLPECTFRARTVATTHRRVRLEARGPALDVEETLGAHVGAEARLGDEVVTGVDPDQVGHDRRVAVGDVAERTGVHEHRRVLEGLEQVRLDGVAHDHRHRPGAFQVLRGHGLAIGGVADDDPPQARSQVLQGGRKGKDGHDLGGGGDVEAGLAGDAVQLGARAR